MPPDLFKMCGGKNRYDKKGALAVINQAMRRRHNRPKHLRAYPCPNCNGWHITHRGRGE